MATIVTRAAKGSPLTSAELDQNQINLNTDKAELSGATFTGAITIPDKIIHAGDTNTFFSFNAADQIQLVTGGVERVAFYNSETHFNDGGTDVNFIVESDGNANMLFVDGGNDVVGIGVAPYTTTGDLNLLGNGVTFRNDKAGSNNNWSLIQNTATGGASNLKFTLGTGNILFGHGGEITTNTVAGYHTVFNEGGVDADFRVESNGNANMLFVDGGNNQVGIGTNSVPSLRTFQVSSSDVVPIEATSSAGETIISIDNTATNGRSYFLISGGNSGTYAGGKFGIFDADATADRMSIDSSGNVTFNEGSVDADFRVESDAEFNAFTVDGGTGQVGVGSRSGFRFGNGSLQGNAGSSGGGYPTIGYNIKFTGTAGNFGTLNGDTSWRMDIGNNNRLQVHSRSATAPVSSGATYTAGPFVSLNGTTWTDSSDARLKENVSTITDAIDKVKAMRPVNYTWIHDGEGASNQVGFIAQEMALVVPEVVDISEDDEVHQGIQYGKLVPVLTAALQEALTKIETLETRLTALENA